MFNGLSACSAKSEPVDEQTVMVNSLPNCKQLGQLSSQDVPNNLNICRAHR